MDRLVMCWHGGIDLALLFALFVINLYFIKKRYAIRRATWWQTTDAKIQACKWVTCGHRLWPKLTYHYQVGEQAYTGEVLFLDPYFYSSRSKYAVHIAFKMATAYKEKQDVLVRYDATDPTRAALDIAASPKLTWIVGVLGLLFLAQVVMVLRLFY